MTIEHDFLVGFSKSFGLFYLLAFSVGVLIYTYWPSNKTRFDHAAQSILHDEDKPFEDKSFEDKSWR